MASLVILATRIDGPAADYPVSRLVFKESSKRIDLGMDGGAGGIRTLDRALQPYNGLANRRLQPLGHSSVRPICPTQGRAASGRFGATGFAGDFIASERASS